MFMGGDVNFTIHRVETRHCFVNNPLPYRKDTKRAFCRTPVKMKFHTHLLEMSPRTRMPHTSKTFPTDQQIRSSTKLANWTGTFQSQLKSTSVKKTTFRTPCLGVSAILETVFLTLLIFLYSK